LFAVQVYLGHSGAPIISNDVVIGLVSAFRTDLPVVGIGVNFIAIRKFLEDTDARLR